MPKLKTNKGALKRFKKMGGGRIKFRRAFRNHILTKKSKKRLRQLRKMGAVHASDVDAVNRMLQDD